MADSGGKARAIDMRIIDRRISCVAVTVCALMQGDILTTTRSFADFDSDVAEPTAAGRQAAAEPGRSVPERFLVTYKGCALLGPDGEEKDASRQSVAGREQSRRTDIGRPSVNPIRTRLRANNRASSSSSHVSTRRNAGSSL